MLRGSLVWKLTIWFLLLSLLPIGVIVLFVRQDVSDELTNLAKDDTGSQVSLLAIEISASIDDRRLQGLIADATNETQVAFLVGTDGAYVAHDDEARVGGFMSDDFSAEVLQRVLGGTDGVAIEEGTGRFVGFSTLPTGALGRRTLFGLLTIKAVLVVDESVVSAPMSRIERSAIVQLSVSLVVIILAIGVAIWVVVRPIKRLTKAAEEVGAGNLDVQIDSAGMEGELAVLTNAFNQMTRQVSGRTRELKILEELGRAIINSPSDASTLPEVLSDHVPIMFPECRIDIRIFPEQTLFCSAGDWPSATPSAWEWLTTASEARYFLPGESFPWLGQTAGDAVVAAPVLDVETKEPIGGIYMSLHRDPDAAPSLLPAVQSLAAQIASALQGARVHAQELALESVSRELALAGQIQANFLPATLPDVPGWKMAATLKPARETSGDFYDFIHLPDGRLGILIADVTDKGMGAALFMALSRTLLRTYAVEYDSQPEVALAAVNRRILADTSAGLFVTVFYGVLDLSSGELTYANAGHNPPYLVNARDGHTIRELDRTGVPLGILDGLTWEQRVVHLAPGDLLLLYTDGITEAQNAQEELFDEDRLREFVRAGPGRSAQDIQDGIIAQVDAFVGDAAQSDDITLMVVVRDPTGAD
jgi:serine phosphatase RsbU (regulator of sigma subunit)/HAMP domain-containing protein